MVIGIIVAAKDIKLCSLGSVVWYWMFVISFACVLDNRYLFKEFWKLVSTPKFVPLYEQARILEYPVVGWYIKSRGSNGIDIIPFFCDSILLVNTATTFDPPTPVTIVGSFIDLRTFLVSSRLVFDRASWTLFYNILKLSYIVGFIKKLPFISTI